MGFRQRAQRLSHQDRFTRQPSRGSHTPLTPTLLSPHHKTCSLFLSEILTLCRKHTHKEGTVARIGRGTTVYIYKEKEGGGREMDGRKGNLERYERKEQAGMGR